MSNRLSMANVNSIETLFASGHSNRQIARLLGINRKTVNRYVRKLKQLESEALAQTGPNPQTASSDDEAQNGPNLQLGRLVSESSEEPAGRSGPQSQCEPFRETIIAKHEQGLSARRIHQDLKADHDFGGSYHSIRRFILRLGAQTHRFRFGEWKLSLVKKLKSILAPPRRSFHRMERNGGLGCCVSFSVIREKLTAKLSIVRPPTTSSQQSKTRFITLAVCRNGW